MQPKVVIVTGGADGFGAAISDRFSQEGCQVIIIDTHSEKGESKCSNDANLHFLLGDVTERNTWTQALTLARDKFGRLDVVVNNAGITGRQSVSESLKKRLTYLTAPSMSIRKKSWSMRRLSMSTLRYSHPRCPPFPITR